SFYVDRAKEILLPQAVLRDFENFRARQYRTHGGNASDRLCRDIFELEGGDVYSGGEPLESFAVGEFGDRRLAASRCCGADGLGREDMATKGESCCRECRHPPELATTQNAERGTRGKACRRLHRSGCSATPRVCACRQPSSACPTAASDRPRIAAAKSAAL